MTERSSARLLEIAFRDAGLHPTPMSELHAGSSPPTFSFTNNVDEHSIYTMDLTFRRNDVVLQEVNGSNGASRGILPDHQRRRAVHMAETVRSRGYRVPGVCLLGHADSTGLLPEFHLRMSLFVEEFRVMTGSVKPYAAGEPLGPVDMSVVIGSISNLVPHITAENGTLWYQQRPVVFASNANLLPALVRAGVIAPPSAHDGFPEAEVFHESRRGVMAVMDKVLQQMLAAGTGFAPLRHASTPSWGAAADEIRRWHAEGMTVVSKIAAGSQGVGIGFSSPHHAHLVGNLLAQMRAEAVAAYGPKAEATALPIQLFEFAESTPYRLGTGDHLWDVRVEVHVVPGTTTILPSSMRLCPSPFDGDTFARDTVVSNLSGRPSSLEFVRAPFAHHASGVTELEWAGIDSERFERAMAACAAWSERALGASA